VGVQPLDWANFIACSITSAFLVTMKPIRAPQAL